MLAICLWSQLHLIWWAHSVVRGLDVDARLSPRANASCAAFSRQVRTIAAMCTTDVMVHPLQALGTCSAVHVLRDMGNSCPGVFGHLDGLQSTTRVHPDRITFVCNDAAP